VDSAAAGNFTLGINTPAGASTVFNGAVGSDALGALSSDTGLGGLTTDAAGATAINGGSVRTSADQSYNDAVTLGADTILSGNNVLFNQSVDSSANQLRRLAVNAAEVTTFNGPIGAHDRLASLTTDAAGRTDLGAGILNVNGTSATAFNDALLLNENLIINQAGVGRVAFANVDSRDGMNAALTVNTPGGGDTVFNGHVGRDELGPRSDNSGLGSLTTDGVGRTIINGMVVRTTGNQNHLDAVTLGANVSLEGGSITLHQVTGGGNDLSVTSDDIALTAGQAIIVPRLTLQPRTPGRDIDLGTEMPGRLSITQEELDTVTAATLQIGSLMSGTLFVTAPMTLIPLKVPTLRLASGGGINAATAPLTVDNLAFQSAGDVTLTAANHLSAVAGTITVNGRNVTICDANDLAIGTVDGLTGITMGDHSALPYGNVTLIADNLAIGQRIEVGSGRVILQSKTAGRDIDLGTETLGSLSLTAAELGRIKAGVLQIGNNVAGAITISGGLDFGVNDSSPRVETLSLESAQTITETPTGWIQVQNLALRSPSRAGVVLDNGMNDWLRLGADVPNGLLVVREMGGYTDASESPNDVDGLTGVSRSGIDIRNAALEGIADVTTAEVTLFWPTTERLEFASPMPRPAGFEEKKLIWTSYLHLPAAPPNPLRQIRKIEEQPKWTTLSLSGGPSGPRPPL
jgi:hypothetical protein